MFKRKPEEQGRQRPVGRQTTAKPFSYYGSSVKTDTVPHRAEQSVDLGKVGKRLRLLPTVIAIAVIAGSLLFSLTLTTHPKVETVDNEPAVYRPLEEYAVAIDEILGQSIANNTKLSINTKDAEKKLMERYPELAAAIIRLPVLGRRPVLVVDINQPSLLLATKSKVYVLDHIGNAVSEASVLSPEQKQGLMVLRDQSGLEVKNGTQAVTTETVNFVLSVNDQLKAKDIKISELTLPAGGNELYIKIEGPNYFIKTDTSGDPRLQIGGFLAVKDRGVTPLEYMDVRVPEKVFYK